MGREGRGGEGRKGERGGTGEGREGKGRPQVKAASTPELFSWRRRCICELILR